MRIVSLGTSLSAGGEWQRELASRLTRPGNAPVEIIVRARPGANSAWGLENLAGVRALEPDLVLLEFAINDASLRHGLTLARSRANIRRIVDALRGTPDRRVMLMTTNPALGVKRLLRPRLPRYYRLYHELAMELGVELADLDARWRALPRAELAAAIPDGLHPTPSAAQRIIVPALLDLIEQPVPAAALSGRRAAPVR